MRQQLYMYYNQSGKKAHSRYFRIQEIDQVELSGRVFLSDSSVDISHHQVGIFYQVLAIMSSTT